MKYKKIKFALSLDFQTFDPDVKYILNLVVLYSFWKENKILLN